MEEKGKCLECKHRKEKVKDGQAYEMTVTCTNKNSKMNGKVVYIYHKIHIAAAAPQIKDNRPSISDCCSCFEKE